jgi:hypothetical protein
VLADSDDTTPVMWSPTGAATILNNFVGADGYEVAAMSINDAGDSCGYLVLPSGDTDAVYWDNLGNSTVLTSLPGSSEDMASSINDAGVIGGRSDGVAVEWSSNGSILWHDPIGRDSGINVINANGDAAG